MADEQTYSAVKTKQVRPVLIASARTIFDYSVILRHYFAGLANESIPVMLICPPASDVEWFISGAVEVVRYPAIDLPFMDRLNRKVLLEKLVKFKPTVLHCISECWSEATRKLSRDLDVPYVLSIDSIQKHHTPLSFLSRRCSSIIVPCQSVRKSVGRRVSDKVQLIEYGTFAEKEPCCFRNTDAMNSMIVNCDFRGKNESVSNLLSAIRHLFIDGNEFVTIFLSSGGDERDIRKQINAFGLRQVVTMAPRDYRWRSAVAAGDVFVRAQKSKTFSPVLLEAMAMGCTIAGCRGGVDDLLLDGKTACVYDAEDELMIYNCLGRILNNRDYARQLGANSQNYIRKNSSVSKMLEQILSAYRFECPAAMVSV